MANLALRKQFIEGHIHNQWGTAVFNRFCIHPTTMREEPIEHLAQPYDAVKKLLLGVLHSPQ